MKLTPRNINTFLFFKLPAAFLCGVRVKSIDRDRCITTVRYRWINQNPFNSMYFAVQAMAAELTTGALILREIRESSGSFSMLVVSHKATFTKKATGKISFVCDDGARIKGVIEKAVEEEAITFVLTSKGTDTSGELVSTMDFEWRLKKRLVTSS